MSNKKEESELVIPVNKDKNYGICVESGRLNVTVYTRKLYTEDTKVPMKFKSAVSYKFYAKGDYGPWVLAPRPYKRDLETALSWIYELMIMDGLEEEKNISELSSIVKEAKEELRSLSSEIVKSIKS